MTDTMPIRLLSDTDFAPANMDVTVYGYNFMTGVYGGKVDTQVLQGMTIPANTTLTPPPDASKIPAGKVAIFSNGAWHIGDNPTTITIWNQTTGQSKEISAGSPIPPGWATTPPPAVNPTPPPDTINTLTYAANLAAAADQFMPYGVMLSDGAKQWGIAVNNAQDWGNKTLTDEEIAALPKPPFDVDKINDPTSPWWIPVPGITNLIQEASNE